MEATREYPSGSLLKLLFRGLRDFETTMEMQPFDYLQLRVAELERRIATLDAAAPRPTSLRAVKES